MAHLSDLELTAQLARGERPAWSSFIDDYGNLLYQQAASTLKNSNFRVVDGELDDLVQDVIEKLLANDGRKLLTFAGRNGCTLKGWLRVVVANHTMSFIRTRKSQVSLESLDENLVNSLLDELRPSNSPRDQLEYRDLLARCGKCLEEQSSRYGLVFQFYYRDGLSNQEIASILQLKANHVDQLLYQIRGHLKKALETENIY